MKGSACLLRDTHSQKDMLHCMPFLLLQQLKVIELKRKNVTKLNKGAAQKVAVSGI